MNFFYSSAVVNSLIILLFVNYGYYSSNEIIGNLNLSISDNFFVAIATFFIFTLIKKNKIIFNTFEYLLTNFLIFIFASKLLNDSLLHDNLFKENIVSIYVYIITFLSFFILYFFRKNILVIKLFFVFFFLSGIFLNSFNDKKASSVKLDEITLSKNKNNKILLVIDTLRSDVFNDHITKSKIFSNGYLFQNYISTFDQTKFSVPFILSNIRKPFDMSHDKYTQLYECNNILSKYKDNGYHVYNLRYEYIKHTIPLRDCNSSYTQTKKIEDKYNFLQKLRFNIGLTFVNTNLSKNFINNLAGMKKYFEIQKESDEDKWNLLLNKTKFKKTSHDTFTYVHFHGMHEPLTPLSDNTYNNYIFNYQKIQKNLDQLLHNILENASKDTQIIIMGDHGANIHEVDPYRYLRKNSLYFDNVVNYFLVNSEASFEKNQVNIASIINRYPILFPMNPFFLLTKFNFDTELFNKYVDLKKERNDINKFVLDRAMTGLFFLDMNNKNDIQVISDVVDTEFVHNNLLINNTLNFKNNSKNLIHYPILSYGALGLSNNIERVNSDYHACSFDNQNKFDCSVTDIKRKKVNPVSFDQYLKRNKINVDKYYLLSLLTDYPNINLYKGNHIISHEELSDSFESLFYDFIAHGNKFKILNLYNKDDIYLSYVDEDRTGVKSMLGFMIQIVNNNDLDHSIEMKLSAQVLDNSNSQFTYSGCNQSFKASLEKTGQLFKIRFAPCDKSKIYISNPRNPMLDSNSKNDYRFINSQLGELTKNNDFIKINNNELAIEGMYSEIQENNSLRYKIISDKASISSNNFCNYNFQINKNENIDIFINEKLMSFESNNELNSFLCGLRDNNTIKLASKIKKNLDIYINQN